MKLHNAVITSEAKRRMRTWRTPVGIFVYVALIFALGAIYFASAFGTKGGVSLMQISNFGQMGYVLLAITQFFLLVFAVLSVTASTISSERERQTLDLLLCTRMKPISIVLGKMFASMGFVLLLVVASFPVYALVLLFGGIVFADLLKLFLFYITTGVYAGSIGMLCSCIFKRTTVATIASFAIVLFIGIGTIAIGFQQYKAQEELANEAYNQWSQQQAQQPGSVSVPPPVSVIKTPKVLYLNPAVGLVDLLLEQTEANTSSMMYSNYGRSFINILPLSRSIFNQDNAIPMPMWIINSIVSVVISIICLIWSAWLIRPLKKKDKRADVSKKRRKKNAAEPA